MHCTATVVPTTDTTVTYNSVNSTVTDGVTAALTYSLIQPDIAMPATNYTTMKCASSDTKPLTYSLIGEGTCSEADCPTQLGCSGRTAQLL